MKITAASQKVKRKALDPALDDSIDSEVNFVKLYCSNNISLHVIYSQNHLAANNRNESIASEVRYGKLHCTNKISFHIIYSQNLLATNNNNDSKKGKRTLWDNRIESVVHIDKQYYSNQNFK